MRRLFGLLLEKLRRLGPVRGPQVPELQVPDLKVTDLKVTGLQVPHP